MVHPPLVALLTVTLKLQVIVFCEESVAVHATIVEPRGNIEPDGGTHDTVTQLPVAVGVV